MQRREKGPINLMLSNIKNQVVRFSPTILLRFSFVLELDKLSFFLKKKLERPSKQY
jgi:hypothetical protein